MSEAQKAVMSEAQIFILRGSASEEEIAAITVACLQLNARSKPKVSANNQPISHWKQVAAYESIRPESSLHQVQTGSLWKN